MPSAPDRHTRAVPREGPRPQLLHQCLVALLHALLHKCHDLRLVAAAVDVGISNPVYSDCLLERTT